MRPRTLARSDLLTDAFPRELHKRMYNQTIFESDRLLMIQQPYVLLHEFVLTFFSFRKEEAP